MENPDNHPLKGGLEKLKGQPLPPSGFQAVLRAVIGDHEYFSNVLKLPHWASHFPCRECGAQSFEGAAPGKYVKKTRFHICSQEEHQKYLEAEGACESHHQVQRMLVHLLLTRAGFAQQCHKICE